MGISSDIWDTVHSEIRDNVTHTGIDNANIVKRKIPWDRTLARPNIQVTMRPETIDPRAGTNASDDIGYNVMVTLTQISNDDLGKDDNWIDTRQNIIDYFNNKRLSGVATVFRCTIIPLEIHVPAGEAANLDIQGLIIRCFARNTTRGV